MSEDHGKAGHFDGVPEVRESHLAESEILDFELQNLDGEAEAAVRAHLNACATCRQQLDALHSEGAGATQIRDPMVGSQLGEYRVESALARGGMGVVYRGVHPLIGKKVAIKVLVPEIQDEGSINRLLDEARAVNAIRHPNIIDIFSFGTMPDGRHYFVMELLDGESLEEVASRKTRLTSDEVLTVLEQSMSALGAAHSAGVIHRDLKPANLFVSVLTDKSWHVTVLDFGLAKRVGNTRKTSSNLVMGTPGFMAPEQIRGAEPVPQTDLYAMGVVAWVLLTGTAPFSAPGIMDLMLAHAKDPLPSLTPLAPDAPTGLVLLVERLLQKRPEDRPASAMAVLSELRAIRSGRAAAPSAPTFAARRQAPTPEPSRPASVVVAGELDPGTLIASNYRVLKRLGAGGFGTVYLGENTTLDQKVVIKTLQVGSRGAGAEEARVLASLDHPNVVHVYAYDERHDCIVMQYLGGKSLLDEMGGLDIVSAIRVGTQVALALSAVHEKGLVHRDIKPENIMIEFKGGEVRSLKVIDFGTALRVGRGLEHPPGTPDYAPPEQFEPLAPAHTANDVYSLGVSLFVICTGRHPFEGTPMELAQHHQSSEVPDLAQTFRAARSGAALDPRLEFCLDRVGGLVAEMMDKEVKRRPDARRVAHVLSEIETDFSSERTQAGFRVGGTPLIPTQRARSSTMVLARRPPKAATADPNPLDSAMAAVHRSRSRRGAVIATVLLAVLVGGALLAGVTMRDVPQNVPEQGDLFVMPTVDSGSDIALKAPEPVVNAPVLEERDAGGEQLTALVTVKVPRGPGPKRVGLTPQPKCQWDDQFRDYARKRADQLRQLTQDKGRFGRLEDQLGDAMVDRNCTKVNMTLRDMRRVAGVPEDE